MAATSPPGALIIGSTALIGGDQFDIYDEQYSSADL